MTTQQEHLLDQELILWLTDDLSNDQSQTVESHLEVCDQCTQHLDELSQPSEPLLDRLRELHVETLVEVKACDKIELDENQTTTQSIENPYCDLGLGVLAMESEAIDGEQFVQAYSQWTSNRERSFVDVLMQLDSLTNSQREAIASLRTSSNWQELQESDNSIKAALLNNKYKQEMQIKKLHSSGGIGRVWLAEDVTLKRDIALKELLPEYVESAEMRRRFIREARITAQLMHPGTVPVHELQENNGIPSYIMRFVEGKTLTNLIAKHHQQRIDEGNLSTAGMLRLLRYFSSVCHTISYAHSQRIIHRDIKSENIIVGDFGEVVVLDWGIAKRIDDNEIIEHETHVDDRPIENQNPKATEYGQRLGTPAFMSPEQALGIISKINELTDVYGLAALLYEILTGFPPFANDTVEQTLHSVVHEPPMMPTQIVDELPKELEAICLRGLSKQPEDRQQSVEQLVREVEDWIALQIERKQLEKERNHFFSISQDLQAIIDANGKIIQCNPACEKLLGWTYDEMTQMSDIDLIPAKHLVAIRSMREKLLTSGEPALGLERKVRHKEGTYRWISWNVTPIVKESNLYIVGRDITEQKRMRQRFVGLLEIMPDAVVATNIKGKIIVANQELSNLFGYSSDEIIGCNVMQLVAERSKEKHLETLKHFAGDRDNWNKKKRYQFYGQHKEGAEFKVEVRHSAFNSETELLFVASIRELHSPRD